MGLSPPGTSLIKVVTVGDQQYWKEQHSDGERYAHEKERVYKTVVDCLESRFSGLRRHIVVHDVTTPVSAERRTGNFLGLLPWLPPELAKTILRRGVSKTLPGLSRFHMVGQWAAGIIGLPHVAIMGRNLIRQLCKTDHKRFQTSANET
jgi:phytoene dehydrogenase-like protein